MRNRDLAVGTAGGCSVFTILGVLVNVLLGGWAIQLTLFGLLGLSVPFLACALAGLFIGAPFVPVAIVLWLLQLGGVVLPLFTPFT